MKKKVQKLTKEECNAANKSMSEALPRILDLLNNPTFLSQYSKAGYIFDSKALFKAFTDVAEWKRKTPIKKIKKKA